MASAIIDGTNIDLSVLSYSDPKANPSGGKVVNVYNKNAKEYFTISVPLMGAWSAQEGKTDKGEPNGKYTMSLQFSSGEYATPETKSFLEQMKLFENKIKADAIVNSRKWFAKDITSMEVMEEKFNPMLKYPKIKGSELKNYEAAPSLTLKIPCWKDVWQPSVFDEDFNPLYVKGQSEVDVTPLQFLTSTGKSPIQVITLIQSGGIWIANGKASITWNLKQAIVRKPKVSSIIDNVCFLNVKPSELETLKSTPQPEIEQLDTSVSAVVEDSDGEEYTVPNATPPPPPVVVETPVVVEKPEIQTPTYTPATASTSAPVPEKKKAITKKIKKDA